MTIQEKARLELYRRACRTSMNRWGEHCGFVPVAHHRLITEKLEAAVRGEINRLAIFLPPGSAKSTWANKLFVPWYLAQRPGLSILAISHSDQKAEDFGGFSRNLAAANPLVLNYTIRGDSKAKGKWETSNGGLFFCAGVGTRIAGNRADLGLIDDPIGSKADAESKLVRDTTWDWYNADFKFRLKPGSVVILIQTRWHEDDLAGRILATEKGWTVVSIPLIAEEGDPLGRSPGSPLWPEYFDAKHIKEMVNSPDFIPMCQQRPTPESGDYFKKEWIEDSTYDSKAELPSELRWYVGSDHAFSQKESADFNAIIPGGVDSQGDLWIPEEIWWPHDPSPEKRPSTVDVVDEMFRLNRLFRPLYWWAGKDHIVGSIGPFIEKMQRERREFIPLEPLSEGRDKQSKCQPIRAMFKLGRVHLPRFAPWYGDALNELLRFDKGTHDDFVDGLEKLGRGLENQVNARKTPEDRDDDPNPEPPKLTLSWVKENVRLQERDREMSAIGM